MTDIIQAVKCAACETLHAVTGSYIIVDSLIIREHKDEENQDYSYKRRDAQSVKREAIIVCNNSCLETLVTLKGF